LQADFVGNATFNRARASGFSLSCRAGGKYEVY
jgi:hypothetical protein